MKRNKSKITLLNLKPLYHMDAATLLLASPSRTAAVQQVLITQSDLIVTELATKRNPSVLEETPDEEEDSESNEVDQKSAAKPEQVHLPVTSKTLRQVLADSHTIVIPDSLFLKESEVFYTDQFLQEGGPAILQELYEQHGVTILVYCLEGIFKVTHELNRWFGTQWTMKFFESGTEVVPTEQGRAILGPFAPSQPLLQDSPHFVSCEDTSEGIYTTRMQTKDEFVHDFHAQDEQFEKLGIEPDPSMDCFNVERSWQKYVDKYTDGYVVCVHRHLAGGHVVWYGDRGQSDTMAYVFCKLLNLGSVENVWGSDQDTTTSPTKRSLLANIRGTWILSLVVVILAVLANYFLAGTQQRSS